MTDWDVQAVYRAVGYRSTALAGPAVRRPRRGGPERRRAGPRPRRRRRSPAPTSPAGSSAGPVGLIGHTKSDAAETVGHLLAETTADRDRADRPATSTPSSSSAASTWPTSTTGCGSTSTRSPSARPRAGCGSRSPAARRCSPQGATDPSHTRPRLFTSRSPGGPTGSVGWIHQPAPPDPGGPPVTLTPQRRLLPMVGSTHGNRSAVTCHLRCGDACFQEVPNTTETSYFRDVAASALTPPHAARRRRRHGSDRRRPDRQPARRGCPQTGGAGSPRAPPARPLAFAPIAARADDRRRRHRAGGLPLGPDHPLGRPDLRRRAGLRRRPTRAPPRRRSSSATTATTSTSS